MNHLLLVHFCPLFMSPSPRHRLPGGAAHSRRKQSEISGQRHCRAAQRPHPGSLQLDPVLPGSRAHFGEEAIAAFDAPEIPARRRKQRLCGELRRSPGVPGRLCAPAVRVPGLCVSDVLSHHQEPLRVATVSPRRAAERPATRIHSGTRGRLRVGPLKIVVALY